MKKILLIILLLISLSSMISCKKECYSCEGSTVCSICYGDGIRSCYMISRAMVGDAPAHNAKTCSECDSNGQMLCNACNATGRCSACK